MSLENFRKLKEIDSLLKMQGSFNKQIEDEQSRLRSLNKKKVENIEDLNQLKSSYIHHQTQLSEIEASLSSTQLQLTRLEESGANETKLLVFIDKIKQLEDQGLDILNQLSEIEVKMAENKTFEKGLSKTYLEIESEVTQEIQRLQNEAKLVLARIESLQTELPSDFKHLLDKTLSKKLPIGPFTRIDAGSCFFCRFKISRPDESLIDMAQNLKTCPQCDRIFLPYGV